MLCWRRLGGSSSRSGPFRNDDGLYIPSSLSLRPCVPPKPVFFHDAPSCSVKKGAVESHQREPRGLSLISYRTVVVRVPSRTPSFRVAFDFPIHVLRSKFYSLEYGTRYVASSLSWGLGILALVFLHWPSTYSEGGAYFELVP